jgi:hypothetical protein
MSKINVRNIVIIVGVSAFDICAGLYDRFNGVGVFNSLLNLSGFSASNIHLLGGMLQGGIGILGIAVVIGIISYLIFMTIGLGAVGSMGGKR